MSRESPSLDLTIGLCVALSAIAITVITAIYTAPLMLEYGWRSLRALIFAGSIGVTLWIGIRLMWSFARRLWRR